MPLDDVEKMLTANHNKGIVTSFASFVVDARPWWYAASRKRKHEDIAASIPARHVPVPQALLDGPTGTLQRGFFACTVRCARDLRPADAAAQRRLATGRPAMTGIKPAKRKPPTPAVNTQARLSLEAERRRLRLQKALGNISNGRLFERALLALEAEIDAGSAASSAA
jgi:hypothetical protein